jgi:hypothetical protein
MNWGEFGRKWRWSDQGIIPSFAWRDLKTTETFCQYRQYPGQNLNPAPHGCRSTAFMPNHSVLHMLYGQIPCRSVSV